MEEILNDQEDSDINVRNGIPSLATLAKLQCNKVHHLITDIGDAPFDLVASILRKMPARQLYEIEKKRSGLKEETGELWKHLIEKDFPERQIPKSKYRLKYGKYLKEKESQLADSKERLKRSFKKINQEKSDRKIIQVNQHWADPTIRKRNNIFNANGVNGSNGPSGIKKNSIIHKAKLEMKARGAIFSPKNVTFSANNYKPREVQKSPVHKIHKPIQAAVCKPRLIQPTVFRMTNNARRTQSSEHIQGGTDSDNNRTESNGIPRSAPHQPSNNSNSNFNNSRKRGMKEPLTAEDAKRRRQEIFGRKVSA